MGASHNHTQILPVELDFVADSGWQDRLVHKSTLFGSKEEEGGWSREEATLASSDEGGTVPLNLTPHSVVLPADTI